MKRKLNLPQSGFRIISEKQRKYIFDNIRKRYVSLTPEEWVRQNIIAYLVEHLNYPPSLIAVEMPLIVNRMNRRADIVLFSRRGEPVLIVECKAPDIKLTQEVFDQAASYNIHMKVEYLIVSNGLIHYCAKLDHDGNKWSFLSQIPDYSVISGD